jgi:phosphoglycerate dehydrogenase-like enzyme
MESGLASRVDIAPARAANKQAEKRGCGVRAIRPSGPGGSSFKLLIHYDRPEVFLDLITARFPELQLCCCPSYAALGADMAAFGPDVVYCIKFEALPYPREDLIASPALKWVSVGGVGLDHLAPWDPARLKVTNSAGVASDVMAQYVLAAILALTLRLPVFARAQAERRWDPQEIRSIADKTVAVLGLGHTGHDVARVRGPEALHEVLGQADYVVVSLPLTAGTRHIIDRRAIAAMKPGAMLIDVSRGGAALDVFEHEPLPPDSPFWGLENVIVTPHSSSVYEGWERGSAAMFCDKLARWRAGQPLEKVVDPARGY